MQPIFTLEYILSLDSLIDFSCTENMQYFQKEKKSLKTLSKFQILIAVCFMAVLYLKNTFAPFTAILAMLLICIALFSLYRLKSFDERLVPTIKKGYYTRGYDKYPFKVEFFEDELRYTFGQSGGCIEYYTLKKIGRGDTYLSLHFTPGETIIFDKTCDFEKILSLVQKNLGVTVGDKK